MRGSQREPRTVFVSRSALPRVTLGRAERLASKRDAHCSNKENDMTFVPDGNRNPIPAESQQPRAIGPSRARGEYLERTHDGTGGLRTTTSPQLEDPIVGWPRADQL